MQIHHTIHTHTLDYFSFYSKLIRQWMNNRIDHTNRDFSLENKICFVDVKTKTNFKRKRLQWITYIVSALITIIQHFVYTFTIVFNSNVTIFYPKPKQEREKNNKEFGQNWFKWKYELFLTTIEKWSFNQHSFLQKKKTKSLFKFIQITYQINCD